jgi:predicted DsbA family dithiol-disulfide isomerase
MSRPVIVIAHDIICPWCWVAVHQVEALQKEFDVDFEWRGYELMPENLEWGEPLPKPEINTRRAPTPTRMELAYAASGLEAPPQIQPKRMRSHNALESLEHSKEEGVFKAWNTLLYRSFWMEGQEVNRLDVLENLGQGVFSDPAAMLAQIQARAYSSRIVPFDDEAYAAGVYNVPTFFIGDQKHAEQPLPVLRRVIRAWLEAPGG